MDNIELAAMRRAEWSVPQLLKIVRQFVADRAGAEALYDGMRAKLGHQLRSGGEIEEMASLQNALSRIIALSLDHEKQCETKWNEKLAIRLGVLLDMSADSIAQTTFYSADRLRDQPHFKRILGVLEANGGLTTRANLISAVGLREANGTRVLKVLEGASLIRRERDGGTVRVRLTQDGHRIVNQWRSPTAGTVAPTPNTPPKRVTLKIAGGPIAGVNEAPSGVTKPQFAFADA